MYFFSFHATILVNKDVYKNGEATKPPSYRQSFWFEASGVRPEHFIARLAVSMRSKFQFHVISRIDIVHLLSVCSVDRR